MRQAVGDKRRAVPRQSWLAFFSSMRFAVALLCLLALASVIGTVLQQNEPAADYVVMFGPFWYSIFEFLGLYDVYSSAWFVLIMLFLVLSTILCLWRHIPLFWRAMRSYRIRVSAHSLAHMAHTRLLDAAPAIGVAKRYLQVAGFRVREVRREGGEVLLAAKKGSGGRWGYVCAHVAIVVICLGGLMDSNMWLKWRVRTGSVVPDATTLLAKDFKPQSQLGVDTLSFRGDVNITEGQRADVVFVPAGDGVVVQNLPFTVQLNRFHVDYYDNGMPKNFASAVTVTDKASGRQQQAIIRVNHPLTVDGITIYQANFGDGGSGLSMDSWNLLADSPQSTPLQAVSMNTLALRVGAQDYRLAFGQLRLMNVETRRSGANAAGRDKWQEVRSVVQRDGEQHNVGPTITYSIRDALGQAHELMNYMQPIGRDGGFYYATGVRSRPNEDYQWLMLPADRNGTLLTFMQWRAALRDGQMRQQLAKAAAQGVDAQIRPQFQETVNTVMALYERGGYPALDGFITQKVPEQDRARMRGFFYQVLFGSASIALDTVLAQQHQPVWPDSPQRRRFVADSLDAYTALTQYPVPLLLQLKHYREVRSSGLQMTRSPGKILVYLGSLLLILGTVLMFYVREKRLWLLYDSQGVRLAMSATRHARGLDDDMALHVVQLARLAKDFSNDAH